MHRCDNKGFVKVDFQNHIKVLVKNVAKIPKLDNRKKLRLKTFWILYFLQKKVLFLRFARIDIFPIWHDFLSAVKMQQKWDSSKEMNATFLKDHFMPIEQFEGVPSRGTP